MSTGHLSRVAHPWIHENTGAHPWRGFIASRVWEAAAFIPVCGGPLVSSKFTTPFPDNHDIFRFLT